MDIKEDLCQYFTIFFWKKSKDTTGARIISEDQQLADELNKPITRKK